MKVRRSPSNLTAQISKAIKNPRNRWLISSIFALVVQCTLYKYNKLAAYRKQIIICGIFVCTPFTFHSADSFALHIVETLLIQSTLHFIVAAVVVLCLLFFVLLPSDFFLCAQISFVRCVFVAFAFCLSHIPHHGYFRVYIQHCL